MPTNNNIGIINKPYVSAVNLLDQREIWNKIVDLQDDAEWTQMMLELGRRTVSVVPWFDNFYNEAKFIIIDTTGATVTGSGTQTITVTNLQAGNNNYIIVGDTIMLPNGKEALVQTLSTTTLPNDTIVMKSVDGTNLTLVASDKLSVIGTAMEEGSLAPANRRFNLASIRNLIQVFSESFKITDIQGMSLREVNVNGDPHVLPQAFLDTLQLMRGKQAATWWAGQVSQTLFSDANPTLTGPQGAGVQTTRGLNQYITTYGILPTTISPGVVTEADLMDLTDRLVSVKAPTDYMMVGGNGPNSVVDVFLKNLGSSGAQSIRMLDKDGQKTNFQAVGFEWGGYSFTKKMLKLLANPQIFNYVASGSTKPEIARSLYLLPMGKCPVYGGVNGDGGAVDYFGMKYMNVGQGMSLGVGTQTGFGDNYIAEFHDGALAPRSIGTGAFFQSRFYSQMGVNIYKPQVFARWTVQ